MQDQLDMQCMEMKQPHEELESAQVALHQTREAFRELQNTTKSENSSKCARHVRAKQSC